MSRRASIESVVLLAALALTLAACDGGQEPSAAMPDPADNASADNPAAASDASANALPLKKPSATDVPMPGATVVPTATVGHAGFGGVHFGMNRGDAESAASGVFDGTAQAAACEQVHRAGQADIVYLFRDGKLQRIDVRTPGVMAEGGGRVGMQADDIRTLYAGHLSEPQKASVPGGHDLKVAGQNGDGIIFETDADGKVTAFRAGVASALDGAGGCS